MNPLKQDHRGMLHFDSNNTQDIRFATFGHTTAEHYDLLFIGKPKCSLTKEFEKAMPYVQVEDFHRAMAWLVAQKHSGKSLPKIIIADTKTNGESIVAELGQLTKTEAYENIDIIFLSEDYSPEEMSQAIEAGANDYFSADISCEDLLMRINFLLKLEELHCNECEEFIPIKEDLRPKFWTLKRAVDITFSLLSIIVLSPLFLLIAIAIKLDSKGSVLYISKRAGRGYQIFDFYKFRTMRQDADKLVQDMKHMNQYSENNTASDSVFFKVKNDPRITKLGSFLRKTSLDEIPQLFNVLKGDMSLVGNRPLPLYEAEKLTQDQWAMRFLAPAGITGLWQVSKRGKGEMSEEERVNLDMEYAAKSSFLYDLKIMLKTPTALMQRESV